MASFTWPDNEIGGGSGTVTSVGLVDSTGLFNISGSPVTTTGTLTIASLATQTANTVWAGPASGSAAAPTFRSLVTADIPGLANAFLNGGNSFGANSTLGNIDNYNLSFITNNTTAMTILANGNVGIGTTSPGAPLDVSGIMNFSGTHTAIIANRIGTGDPTGRFDIYSDATGNDGGAYFTLYGPNYVGRTGRMDFVSGTGGPITFQNFNGAGWAYNMVILPNGDVGIGTTSPAGTLDISNGTSNVYVSFSTVFPRIYLGGTAGSGIAGVFNRVNSGTTMYFGETVDTGGYQFRSSGSTCFQGSVGIGTTTPQAGLDVALTGATNSAIIVPRDTTANRPSSPVNGMIRYNTDTNHLEGYVNGAWGNIL